MTVRDIARAGVWAALCATLLGCDAPKSQAAAVENKVDDTAKPAALTATTGPTCDRCRETLCAEGSTVGANLVAGCFKKPDPKLVPNPDPKFTQDCKAAVECAFKHDCGYDAATGPVHCYCGSRLVDECLAQGPAADAPCVAEWKAATRSTSNAEILERFSLIEYPSGWAFNLLECDRDRCGAKSSVGRCTP
jgi:hypothetical protein